VTGFDGAVSTRITAVNRRRRPIRLGTLLDDLRPMADRVVAELIHCNVAVWLQDRAYFTCGRPGIAPRLAPEHFVGTYGAGADTANVLAELTMIRDAHMRHAFTCE